MRDKNKRKRDDSRLKAKRVVRVVEVKSIRQKNDDGKLLLGCNDKRGNCLTTRNQERVLAKDQLEQRDVTGTLKIQRTLHG